jgi:hypothetical protein
MEGIISEISFLVPRMLFLEAPLLFAVLIALLIALFWDNQSNRTTSKAPLALEVVVWPLIIFTIFLISEVLPFTAMARSYYPILPLLIIAVFTSYHSLVKNKPAYKIGAIITFGCFFIFQLIHIYSMHAPRTEFHRFVANLDGITNVYFHQKDSLIATKEFIASFSTANDNLDPFRKNNIKDKFRRKAVTSFSEIKLHPRENTLILIGPHGSKSGRSVIHGCLLDDFEIDLNQIQAPASAIEYKFRHYGYLPKLLMEEEACQALYFNGEMPNINDSEKQITAWFIPSHVNSPELKFAEMEYVDKQILRNGNFETYGGWRRHNNTVFAEYTKLEKHDGLKSFKFTTDDSDQGIRSSVFSTETGRKYKLTAWVYPKDQDKAKLIIRNGTDTNWAYDTLGIGVIPNTWNYVEIVYNEKTGGNNAYILMLSPNEVNEGTWYWDDVNIKKAPESASTGLRP